MTNSTASILSGVAVVGVITTSILCGRATIKANEILNSKKGEPKKEKLKAVLPVYIPTIVVGGLTIAAIISSDVIKTNNYNSLLSTYALTANSFNTYKTAAEKLLTDDQKKEVEDITDKEIVEKTHTVIERTGNGDTLFIEDLTGRQWLSAVDKVYKAQQLFQERINLGGAGCLNVLHEGYGLRPSDIGKRLIWDPYQMDCDYGSTNIGFRNKKMYVNGQECYLIKYIVNPNIELEN